MNQKLYVGNLPLQVNGSDLDQLFSQFGEVRSAQIVEDRETGRSRGFGFVEMVSDDDAQATIDELDGREYQGRRLTVNEARPREPRVSGGSGGGYGSSGYGDRGASGGYGRRY